MNLVLVEKFVSDLSALPFGDVVAFLVLLVTFAIILQLILWIALKILKFVVSKTTASLDDRMLRVLGFYVPILVFLTSIWLSFDAVYPNLMIGSYSIFEIYIILLLVCSAFLSSAIIDTFLLWYGLEIRAHKKTRDEEVFPFVRNVVRGTILLIFAIFILQKMGFETSAILTGLGVGGLAVALGLQDTLTNFFGGVHILVDKPFREEDIIKLENGIEGTVRQIGWRTTRIITGANNEVIVPNSKLAGAILENYSSQATIGVWYSLDVSHKEDVEKVEKIIMTVLERLAEKEENMVKNTVWVRFDAFVEYKLNFKFGYMVRGYPNRWGILKKLNIALFQAFKKNRIKIAMPVRVIYEKDQ